LDIVIWNLSKIKEGRHGEKCYQKFDAQGFYEKIGGSLFPSAAQASAPTTA